MLYLRIIWWHMCRLQFYDRFAKLLDSMFSSCATMLVCFVSSCVRSPKVVGSRTSATRMSLMLWQQNKQKPFIGFYGIIHR